MLLTQKLDEIQAGAFENNTTMPANVGQLIGSILPYIFGAAAILLLIYLVTAGLSMMLSRGDPKAMQATQTKITNAFIGFIIVFFAFTLVSLIGKVLGIDAFKYIFISK